MKKTIMLGSDRGINIVQCTVAEDGKERRFYCKFCKTTHVHSSDPGHRTAHCTSEISPFKEKGYFLMTRPECIQYYANKLRTDKVWVERALLRLLEAQTDDEQMVQESFVRNGKGFTPADAQWMTRFADYVASGYHLSPTQLGICFDKLPKYAAQLYKLVVKKYND